MASKGVKSLSRESVTPAAALRIPVIAAMLPATTFGTVIRSPPTVSYTQLRAHETEADVV